MSVEQVFANRKIFLPENLELNELYLKDRKTFKIFAKKFEYDRFPLKKSEKAAVKEIYSDIKVYHLLKKDPNSFLEKIESGVSYHDLAASASVNSKYLFMYLFPLKYRSFNLILDEENDFYSVLTEEEKVFFPEYEKFFCKIKNSLRLLGQDLKNIDFSYHGKISINGKEYSRVVFCPTCYILKPVEPETLYVFLRGCLQEDVFTEKNSDCVMWPFKVVKTVVEQEPVKIDKKTFRHEILSEISLFLRTLKARNPSSISIPREKNPCKKIGLERAKEKILSSKKVIIFRHQLDLRYDISNIRDDFLSQSKIFRSLENQDETRFSQENFLLNHLYLNHGRIYDYYIAHTPQEKYFLSLISGAYDIKTLNAHESIYEQNLRKFFSDNNIRFLTDKEIFSVLKKNFPLEKLKFSMTPDFYFPDGIFINGELSYWIELKRKTHRISEQISRYAKYLGHGAIILEEGFSSSFPNIYKYESYQIPCFDGTLEISINN